MFISLASSMHQFEMLKYIHYGCFLRDAHFTVPTFEFNFEVKLPLPNKGRFIVKRDRIGRIVKTIVPPTTITVL